MGSFKNDGRCTWFTVDEVIFFSTNSGQIVWRQMDEFTRFTAQSRLSGVRHVLVNRIGFVDNNISRLITTLCGQQRKNEKIYFNFNYLECLPIAGIGIDVAPRFRYEDGYFAEKSAVFGRFVKNWRRFLNHPLQTRISISIGCKWKY